MKQQRPRFGAGGLGMVLALLMTCMASGVLAQGGSSAEIYGHAMLDMGYQAKQNHPDWFDVVRPTKLPSDEDEFGKDGRWFSSVRQSRLGVRTTTPTSLGELKTIFEFELFGTGPDAGPTTFRLRHAYGELGAFGAGQYWSPFMEIDGFPNSLEYCESKHLPGVLQFDDTCMNSQKCQCTQHVMQPSHGGSRTRSRCLAPGGRTREPAEASARPAPP